MRKWTIFGAGHLFCDLYDAILRNGEEIAEVVLNEEIDPEVKKKIPGHIGLVRIGEYRPSGNPCIFGFTSPRKERFLAALSGLEVVFGNLVHPASCLGLNVKLGRGNFIGAQSVIGSNAALGDFNYINRKASVGHDTVIGSFNHLGPGSNVAGLVRMGDRNFIGIGANVSDRARISSNVTVGAGGVVVRDIAEAGTYVGVPVRKIASGQ